MEIIFDFPASIIAGKISNDIVYINVANSGESIEDERLSQVLSRLMEVGNGFSNKEGCNNGQRSHSGREG